MEIGSISDRDRKLQVKQIKLKALNIFVNKLLSSNLNKHYT